MPKNRWGGASGPTSKTGRLGRTARRARDWADKKTGGKASTAWKAARKKRGFRARTRAARKAVRAQGGGWFISGLFGLVAALAAGFAALFGWLTTSKGGKPEGNAPEDTAETPAEPDGHDIPDWVNPNRTTPDETNPADDKPAPTTPNTTGGIMSGLPAAQIAHDMAAAMSRYEPADAWAVVAEAKQWPDVSAQVAMSVKAYADRLEGARFPLNPAIVGKLQEYFQMLAASRSLAEELHPLLQRAHADDLARREAPRGDESKWNV